jgi:2-deoxy-D-gluconate 3-dehydrogenase
VSAELFSLAGKAALVTGAGSGLGLAIAAGLAQAGADVAGVGRSDLAQAAIAVRSAGRKFHAIRADLGGRPDFAGIVREAVAGLGRLDILVNNAGLIRRADALDFTEQDWDEVMTVNLRSVFFLSQAAARQMLAQGGGGSIINIASMLGHTTQPLVPSYCAAKAGVIHLSRAMALELAAHKIRVNAIAPGFFDSEMTHDYLGSNAGRAMATRIPMKRTGAANELDGALLLLASDASSYMTGAVLTVDGGHSLGL